MKRNMVTLSLTCLILLYADAYATIADVERIIDRPSDPVMHFVRWDLEEALEEIGISTMNPKERMVLLKEFYDRSRKRASERSIWPVTRLMTLFYLGGFVESLFHTTRYAIKVARPGIFGVIGQSVNGYYATASFISLMYSGKKLADSLKKRQELKCAQRRVTYFKELIERYEHNPSAKF